MHGKIGSIGPRNNSSSLLNPSGWNLPIHHPSNPPIYKQKGMNHHPHTIFYFIIRTQIKRLRINPSILVFMYSSDELPPLSVEMNYLKVSTDSFIIYNQPIFCHHLTINQSINQVFMEESWPNPTLQSAADTTSTVTGPSVCWLLHDPFETREYRLAIYVAFINHPIQHWICREWKWVVPIPGNLPTIGWIPVRMNIFWYLVRLWILLIIVVVVRNDWFIG